MTLHLTDLTVFDPEGDWTSLGRRPATESDLLSVLTDEALIGELVKRGVLHHETQFDSVRDAYRDIMVTTARTRVLSRWRPTSGEPVGSVEGEG